MGNLFDVAISLASMNTPLHFPHLHAQVSQVNSILQPPFLCQRPGWRETKTCSWKSRRWVQNVSCINVDASDHTDSCLRLDYLSLGVCFKGRLSMSFLVKAATLYEHGQFWLHGARAMSTIRADALEVTSTREVPNIRQ